MKKVTSRDIWGGGGGLKFGIFTGTSFLNGPLHFCNFQENHVFLRE